MQHALLTANSDVFLQLFHLLQLNWMEICNECQKCAWAHLCDLNILHTEGQVWLTSEIQSQYQKHMLHSLHKTQQLAEQRKQLFRIHLWTSLRSARQSTTVDFTFCSFQHYIALGENNNTKQLKVACLCLTQHECRVSILINRVVLNVILFNSLNVALPSLTNYLNVACHYLQW